MNMPDYLTATCDGLIMSYQKEYGLYVLGVFRAHGNVAGNPSITLIKCNHCYAFNKAGRKLLIKKKERKWSVSKSF
jgi:hypothetical protein